jgi:hypothetical protein
LRYFAIIVSSFAANREIGFQLWAWWHLDIVSKVIFEARHIY